MSVECIDDSAKSTEGGGRERWTIYVDIEDEDGEKRREKIRDLTPYEVTQVSKASSAEAKLDALVKIVNDVRRQYPLPTGIVMSAE